MKRMLLGSVAAIAVVASVGLASAQTSGGAAAPAAGGMKTESPAAAQPRGDSGAPSAQPAAKGAAAETSPAAPSRTGAAPDAKPAEMKADSTAKPGAAAPSTAAKDTAAGASKDAKSPSADAKSANPTADSKATPDSKTTGNAATSANAAPPTEKRSQITTAIKQEKVEEVTNVNFNISVGTAVPASVRYHPLPPRIVEIYPEWRGYDFIFVRGKYVILRPQTREIVYIIEG